MWSTGINRNIVECKALHCNYKLLIYQVLIETLWNVKLKRLSGYRLIISRINRNIVECKAIQIIIGVFSVHSINRNIVECKANSTGGIFCKCACSINRNIVECKVRLVHLSAACPWY